MIKLSLTTEGLLDKSRLDAWTRAKQSAIRMAVPDGMREGGKAMAEAARGRMQSDFTVRKSGFVKSLRAKVYDRDNSRQPALLIGSKIPWLGIHVRGGTIGGKMPIPLTEDGKRMGRKAFARVIAALLRSGNAFFIQKNGKAILMAENLKESASSLSRFKRAERQRTGARSIKRGQEIPIAVLVPSVTLKRRFDLEGVVRGQPPALARTIQQALNRARG